MCVFVYILVRLREKWLHQQYRISKEYNVGFFCKMNDNYIRQCENLCNTRGKQCKFIPMRKILFVTILILVYSTMINAQSSSESESAKQAIKQVIVDQSKAWNRGDIDGFMEGYWKSDKMVFISGNTITRGWQQALDRYKKGYPDKATMGKLLFSELEIEPLSQDAAVVIGRFTLIREKDKPTGLFTLTFKKIDGKWVIVMDHTS